MLEPAQSTASAPLFIAVTSADSVEIHVELAATEGIGLGVAVGVEVMVDVDVVVEDAPVVAVGVAFGVAVETGAAVESGCRIGVLEGAPVGSDGSDPETDPPEAAEPAEEETDELRPSTRQP